jgi:hypothetical protein
MNIVIDTYAKLASVQKYNNGNLAHSKEKLEKERFKIALANLLHKKYDN